MALQNRFDGGEVGELYPVLAARLHRIVSGDVHAPEAVIDDACQFAWLSLVRHCEGVRREAALSWLATTAVREAVRLLRRDGRELSLEATFDAAEDVAPAPLPGPDDVVEQRERLQSIHALPARQQRLMWLQGFGLSYREMASHEACTTRTVERQLYRAKAALRQAAEL